MIGIEIFQAHSTAEEWRFRVRARNGEIVAASEGYTTKAAAEKGIRALRRALLPGTRDAETLVETRRREIQAKAWREGADFTNGYEKDYTAAELEVENPYGYEVPAQEPPC